MIEFLLISLAMSAPFLAVLMGLTLVLPSRRWVKAFIALIWIVFAGLWAQHFHESSQPGYDSGPGGGLGLIIALLATMGIVIGTIFYAVALCWYDKRTADRATPPRP